VSAQQDTIMENEQSSASLWANPDSFSPLLDKARQFAGEYLDTLEKRPVFPTEDSLKAMNMLDEPLPQSASDPVLSLKLLHEIGSHATVAQISGRVLWLRQRRNNSGRACCENGWLMCGIRTPRIM